MLESVSAHAAVNMNNSNQFVIGRIGAPASTFEFDGKIDDICLWSKALTSGEVTELYTKGPYPWN